MREIYIKHNKSLKFSKNILICVVFFNIYIYGNEGYLYKTQ